MRSTRAGTSRPGNSRNSSLRRSGRRSSHCGQPTKKWRGANVRTHRPQTPPIPGHRGYGTTRFLSSETFRNAQQSAVALDIIALMDALRIKKAIVAGFDWGSRTAAILAALWPERCKALVAVSGYLITNRKANLQPLPPAAELGWWYQYYFSTARGRVVYAK